MTSLSHQEGDYINVSKALHDFIFIPIWSPKALLASKSGTQFTNVPSGIEIKGTMGNIMSKCYLFFIYFPFSDHVFLGLESVSGSVAGVPMTTNASSLLFLSTLMTFPTIEHSAWTCCKDSSLRKLDKSWSVLGQNKRQLILFIIH